jgi:sugar lactone lactonase YvrE
MKNLIFLSIIASILLSLTACMEQKGTHKPELYFSFEEYCNTPDGMVLDDKNNIILSCPNFNMSKYPGILMKITPEDKMEFFFSLPTHPKTGKVGPMDMMFGPDGNLYIADNQFFYDKDNASRLLKVVMKNGKPVGVEVVVTGFKLSNAVVWKGDTLYVSDTFWDVPGIERSSAIFKFDLDELDGDNPVQLQPGNDPHLFTTFSTRKNRYGVHGGADGMVLDQEGNLYTGLFGDGRMFKMTLNKDGSLKNKKVFVDQPETLPCVDGLFFDEKRKVIYVADSKKNAIRQVTLDGKVSTLWENGNTDGSGGMLDQPCEPQVRGNKLIVANFDKPSPGFKNDEFDAPYTLSVIDLK